MMKRVILMLVLFISLIIPITVRPQTSSITLDVFQDLTSIDLGGIVMSSGLVNQPRIARIVIMPENKEVYIELVTVWKKDASSSFRQLLTFRSNLFLSRIVFNDEFGTVIKGSETWDKDLVSDLVTKGKPTGILGITARLFDKNNIFLSQDYKEIVFLNPSPTISIIAPMEGSSYDVGSVVALWTPVQGASSYKILANVIPEGSSSLEDALRSSNPVINNKDVGDITSIDLRSILDREWIGGQRIVLSITAVIPGPGGGSQIPSVPLTFSLNKLGESSVVVITPELLKLAELINGSVSQTFLNNIMNGQVTIQYVTDETDGNVDPTDLFRILSNLLADRSSIISIKFTPK